MTYFANSIKRSNRTIDDWLEKIGYYRKCIARDDTCIFRIVSEQLYDVQTLHEKVKRDTFKFIRDNQRLNKLIDIFGDVGDYLFDVDSDAVVFGLREIKAMGLLYKREILMFYAEETAMEQITHNNYEKTFMFCQYSVVDDHYDAVFVLKSIENAAFCQSIVYKIFYDNIFDIPYIDEIVHLMLHTEKTDDGEERIRAASMSNDNWNFSEPLPEILRTLVEEHSGPFSYKVAKTLDPNIYRNIEFDNWLELKKELRFKNFYKGGSNFVEGVKCLVNIRNDLDDNCQMVCHIQSIREDPDYPNELNEQLCDVFVENLVKTITVKWKQLEPLASAEPWPIPMKTPRNPRVNSMMMNRFQRDSMCSEYYDEDIQRASTSSVASKSYSNELFKDIPKYNPPYTANYYQQPSSSSVNVNDDQQDTSGRRTSTIVPTTDYQQCSYVPVVYSCVEPPGTSAGTTETVAGNAAGVSYSYQYVPCVYDCTGKSYYAVVDPQAPTTATYGQVAGNGTTTNGLIGANGVNLNADKSIYVDGYDLPSDTPTLQFFYNLGVDYYRMIYPQAGRVAQKTIGTDGEEFRESSGYAIQSSEVTSTSNDDRESRGNGCGSIHEEFEDSAIIAVKKSDSRLFANTPPRFRNNAQWMRDRQYSYMSNGGNKVKKIQIISTTNVKNVRNQNVNPIASMASSSSTSSMNTIVMPVMSVIDSPSKGPSNKETPTPLMSPTISSTSDSKYVKHPDKPLFASSDKDSRITSKDSVLRTMPLPNHSSASSTNPPRDPNPSISNPMMMVSSSTNGYMQPITYIQHPQQSGIGYGQTVQIVPQSYQTVGSIPLVTNQSHVPMATVQIPINQQGNQQAVQAGQTAPGSYGYVPQYYTQYTGQVYPYQPVPSAYYSYDSKAVGAVPAVPTHYPMVVSGYYTPKRVECVEVSPSNSQVFVGSTAYGDDGK